MRIEPASHIHLADARDAYEHARGLQRAQGAIEWPEFSDASILAEIDARRLYRVMDGDTLVGVFTVTYDDAAIWGEHERGAHVYLHRIARAASYPGRGLMAAILDWAFAHNDSLGRDGIRMDTWASNTELIAFYQRLGFSLVGARRIGVESRLPKHYHGNEFALLERARG